MSTRNQDVIHIAADVGSNDAHQAASFVPAPSASLDGLFAGRSGLGENGQGLEAGKYGKRGDSADATKRPCRPDAELFGREACLNAFAYHQRRSAATEFDGCATDCAKHAPFGLRPALGLIKRMRWTAVTELSIDGWNAASMTGMNAGDLVPPQAVRMEP